MYNIEMNDIKKQFQIFENYKNEVGKELIYLDSAASSLNPDSVIEKMNEYYFHYRSNIDRAASLISITATNEYNESRKILAKYLNCSDEDIIWTSGATMSSNMLCDMIAMHDDEFKFLEEGDEILTTIVEHHSSLLPLQRLVQKKKMNLKFLDLDSYLDLDLSNLRDLVSLKTKIVSISLASNVLGTINDIKSIVIEIKKINKNVFVICDMTSAFGHIGIDMSDLGKYIDAAYFSLHKAFGPTGVGVLWMKRDLSRHMEPSILGGGIVSHVSKENFSLRSDIKVFEAGTSNIAGVIGAGEAIRFLSTLKNKPKENSERLVEIFFEKIKELNIDPSLEVNIFAGPAARNIGIVSFQTIVNGKEVHPHDVAEIFARFNISVRAGHHCAEPLMSYFNISNGLTRVSFHIYNTEEDIDKVIEALKEVKKIFGK